MDIHLMIGLLLALLATVSSGGRVPKWSSAYNWNTTNSTALLRDTSTPVNYVSLTDLVILTHPTTIMEAVTLTSPVTVTVVTTVINTVTLPANTVYVTQTVIDPTLGCVAPLTTASSNSPGAPHSDWQSMPSTSSDEDYTVTSFYTSTKTIRIISVTKPSTTSEVTVVVPCNGPSEASSSDIGPTSTETLTVWPIPEDSTSTTKKKTTTITSTITNVVTDTLVSISPSSTSSAKTPVILRSTGLSNSYQNTTYTSTASTHSVSIFNPIFATQSLSVHTWADNRTMLVRHMLKREAGTQITAIINGVPVSRKTRYHIPTLTQSTITGKNPGGPIISGLGIIPSRASDMGHVSATSSALALMRY